MLGDESMSHMQKVYLQAEISFSSLSPKIECLVREFSQSGARFILSDSTPLPDTFDLRINKKGKSFRAKFIERQGDEVTVDFALEAPRQNEHPLQEVGPDQHDIGMFLLQRIAELEAENAVLHRMVNQKNPDNCPS